MAQRSICCTTALWGNAVCKIPSTQKKPEPKRKTSGYWISGECLTCALQSALHRFEHDHLRLLPSCLFSMRMCVVIGKQVVPVT